MKIKQTPLTEYEIKKLFKNHHYPISWKDLWWITRTIENRHGIEYKKKHVSRCTT